MKREFKDIPDIIKALYENRTDVIVSQETTSGDVWQCEITPNDGNQDGSTLSSNNLTIVVADTTSPTIHSVNDTPDPVDAGENITITANVTDDVGISSTWVEISGTNYTMRQGAGLENDTATIRPNSAGSYETNTAEYSND